MWLYLNDAFLSVVAHRQRPDVLLVRARIGGDLERVFPGAKVARTPSADYRYRAEIPRGEFARVLAERALAIDYPNFKGSVEDEARHDAYLALWAVTMREAARLDAAPIARQPKARPKRRRAHGTQLELVNPRRVRRPRR